MSVDDSEDGLCTRRDNEHCCELVATPRINRNVAEHGAVDEEKQQVTCPQKVNGFPENRGPARQHDQPDEGECKETARLQRRERRAPDGGQQKQEYRDHDDRRYHGIDVLAQDLDRREEVEDRQDLVNRGERKYGE